MLLYPPKLSKYPPANVMIVAKYLFVRVFTIGETSFPSSTSNNSWKDSLPIRATASNEVKAKAETNMVMIHNPHS